MADPFSIVTGCVGLISAAGATVNAIISFVRDCRAARGDLTIVARELTDLQLILELLKDDGQRNALPNPLQDQINHIVKRCSRIVSDINSELKRCKGKSGAAAWAADGKKAVEGLRRDLATNRELLSLTVETTTLFIAKSIKEDTEVIRGAIPEIKHDTERILQEIQDFRIAYQPGTEKTNVNGLLDNYLDGITTYAETVCEEVIWDSDDDGTCKEEARNSGQSANTTKPKNTIQDNNGVEELGEQATPDPEPAKKTCYSCKSQKSDGGAFGFSCDHWMCAKCVRTKFKEATRREDYPVCCKTSALSPRRASHLLSDELKNKFDKVFGYHKTRCPKESCGGHTKSLVKRHSQRRRPEFCSKCDYKYCSWCGEGWHFRSRPKCKADFELLPSFPEKVSETPESDEDNGPCVEDCNGGDNI